MANSVYPKGLSSFLTKGIDVSADTVKTMLVDNTYTYSSAHQFVSDVTGTAIIQRGGSGLASKTTTSGVFDAADFTHTAVTTGKTIAAVIVYDDTPATDAGKNLLAFIDHDSGGSAISQATNGGDITLQFNASGIFSI